jgi:hypothetical protein
MIPAREALRQAYDAAIEEIDSARGSRQLTNAFYAKIGDAIFEACYSAPSPECVQWDTRRVSTAARHGGGAISNVTRLATADG